jgi:hypothetical protein
VDERVRGEIEQSKDESPIQTARGDEPTAEGEKALDKSLSFKLDTLILVVCALNFVLQGIDKGDIGNAATTKNKIVFYQNRQQELQLWSFDAGFVSCSFHLPRPVIS